MVTRFAFSVKKFPSKCGLRICTTIQWGYSSCTCGFLLVRITTAKLRGYELFRDNLRRVPGPWTIQQIRDCSGKSGTDGAYERAMRLLCWLYELCNLFGLIPVLNCSGWKLSNEGRMWRLRRLVYEGSRRFPSVMSRVMLKQNFTVQPKIGIDKCSRPNWYFD